MTHTNITEPPLMAPICFAFPEVASTELSTNLQSIIWSSTPHDVFVLEHTTAWLNWTHRLKDDAKIVWTFIKSENEEITLMSRVGSNIEVEKEDYHFRIGFVDSPGSAIMYLRNVNGADAGRYQVTISDNVPDSEIHRSTLNMNVIYPSNVRISITIEEVTFNLSVAHNGTNISLPDYKMIPSNRPPSITVTVSNYVPTPTSIAHTVKNKQGSCAGEELKTEECANCRQYTFPWYDEMLIGVHFDIHNLKVVNVRTNITIPGSWKTTPGDLKILADTTGSFNWTHNIPKPCNTTWTYKGNPPRSDVCIMIYTNEVVHTPEIDWHSRVAFIRFDGSAAMTLAKVTREDEGMYEVKVVDLNSSPPGYYITDEVRLHVYSAYEITFIITFDKSKFEFVAEKNAIRKLDNWVATRASTTRVVVTVADSAPEPLLIAIYSHTKGVFYGDVNQIFATSCHDACKSTRECERNIVYGLDADRHNTTEVTVNITFDIQNLSPIIVTRDIVIHTGLSTTDISLICLVVVLIVLVAVLGLLLYFTVRRFRGKNKASTNEIILLLKTKESSCTTKT